MGIFTPIRMFYEREPQHIRREFLCQDGVLRAVCLKMLMPRRKRKQKYIFYKRIQMRYDGIPRTRLICRSGLVEVGCTILIAHRLKQSGMVRQGRERHHLSAMYSHTWTLRRLLGVPGGMIFPTLYRSPNYFRMVHTPLNPVKTCPASSRRVPGRRNLPARTCC